MGGRIILCEFRRETSKIFSAQRGIFGTLLDALEKEEVRVIHKILSKSRKVLPEFQRFL